MTIRSKPTNDNYRNGWDRMHKKTRRKMGVIEAADHLSGVTDCHRGIVAGTKNKQAQQILNRLRTEVLMRVDQRDEIARIIYDEYRKRGIEEANTCTWAKLNIQTKAMYLRIAMRLQGRGYKKHAKTVS